MIRKHNGFTLIEIIIVIFVISIAIMAATLTIGNSGGGREMRKQAEQLHRVLQLASQTAAVEQMDLSVGFWRSGYAVWRHDAVNKTWILIKNERGLREYDMPTSIQISLNINAQQVSLPYTIKDVKTPQISFFTTGEATPAEIIFTTSGNLETIMQVKNNGEVKILE